MTVLINDTFTDTDGVLLENHTPEIGGAWVQSLAYPYSLEIFGNAIFRNSSSNSSVYLNSTIPGSDDYSIEIVATNDDRSAALGVAMRHSTSATANGYLCRQDDSGNKFDLYRMVSGGATTQIHSWGSVPTATTPVTLKWATTIDVNGDPTFEFFLNGVSQGVFVDTDATAVTDIGSVGVYVKNSEEYLDSFVLDGAAPSATIPDITGTLDILDGSVGDVYSINCASLNTGGVADSWAWSGTQPTWASLDTATGIITGTATEGTWSGYAVVATNTAGSSTSNTDSVTISAAPSATIPDITGTLDILDGSVGDVYSINCASLNAGGVADSWAWSGTQPTWASLDTATGIITGTATEGTWSGYAVVATNTAGSSASNTDSVTISVVGSGDTIALDGIEQFKVVQREGNFGSLLVEGSHSGTPAAIEARVTSGGVEIVVWQVLDASPNYSSFSGTISIPTGGPYAVEARYSNEHAVISIDTEGFFVGDIFLITGQSNAVFWFNDPDYPAAVADPLLGINENKNWRASEPTDRAATFAGNLWISETGVPCGVVAAASNGSSLRQASTTDTNYWLTTANERGNRYNSVFTAVLADIGGKAAGIVWDQASADATGGATGAEYQASLEILLQFFRADLSNSELPISVVYLGRSENPGDAAEDAAWHDIRIAQKAVIDADTNAYSASTIGVAKRDASHDLDHRVRAARSMQAFLYLKGLKTYYASPQLSAVTRISSTIFDVTITHYGGTTVTPTSGISGFVVRDAGVDVGISSVVLNTDTTVRITLTLAAVGEISIGYDYGRSPDITGQLYDNSTLVLPVEWADFIAEGALSNSITLTDIPAYSVFQRVISDGTVPISGAYTGTATGVQARIMFGGSEFMPWLTIDSSPSGGIFSGSLPVPWGANYTVEVRLLNDILVTSVGTNLWHVGDIIIVAGQSNAERMFIGSGVTPVSNEISIYRGSWNIGTANIASPALAMANLYYTETSGMPIGIVRAALGGTALREVNDTGAGFWLSTTDTRAGLYVSLFQTILADIGGKCAGIVWAQGETDAGQLVTEAEYEASLAALVGFFRADTGGANLPICINYIGRGTDPGDSAAAYEGVRNAERTVVESSANSYGVSIIDVALADVIHDLDHTIRAKRSGQAIAYAKGYVSYYQGPTISSISYIDSSTVDVNMSHNGGTDFTPTSGITGFEVLDNGTPVAITSASQTSATSIRLALTNPLVGTVTARYLYGNNPDITGDVFDNSALVLPLEWTDSVAVAAPSTSKKIVINLVNVSDASQPNLTGLKWAFFDEARPDLLTTVVDSGNAETTDASGDLSISLPSTSLAVGNVGWLVVSDSDGLVATDHKAFCGPVTIEAA